jgi:hypothetical protein
MQKRQNYKLVKCETGVIVIVTVRNIGRIGVVFKDFYKHEYTSHTLPKYIRAEAKKMLEEPNVLCSSGKCNNCGLKEALPKFNPELLHDTTWAQQYK